MEIIKFSHKFLVYILTFYIKLVGELIQNELKVVTKVILTKYKFQFD